MSNPKLVDIRPDLGVKKVSSRSKRSKNFSLLKEYWILLKRYKWAILFFVLMGGAVGYMNYLTATPIYRASLTMVIEDQRSYSGRPGEFYFSSMHPTILFLTQTDIIQSRSIAERTAEKLDPSRYLWLGKRSDKSYLDILKGLLNIESSEPERHTPISLEEKRAAMLANINGNITVTKERRSRFVHLKFDSDDPEFAADVINTAAEAYMELSLDTRLEQAKVASGWLAGQVENLRVKVADAEAELQAYQASQNLVDSSKNRDLVQSRLSALTGSYINAQNKVSQLEERYGEKHPTLIAARAEMSELASRLDEEKRAAVGSQVQEFKLAKLERDVATYQQLYDEFLGRIKEADVATQYRVNNARIIDKAQVPSSPIYPNRNSIIFSYLMGGLFLGVFLILLRDRLDSSFKNPHEIERRTGLPVVGVLPMLPKKRGGTKPERYFVHNKKSGFAESVNHIRTSVLYTNVDNPPKVIMITSALQGEGKTTLSSNLALSFSQIGKTLLIDADMRKPRVAEIVGATRAGGLADIIAGQLDIDLALTDDDQSESLYILKSGTQPPNPLELLSSQRFAQLLDNLRGKFDHIVIDSAPVLPVSDAVVLGNLVDASLMVVRGEKTTRSAAANALDRLMNANVPIVGVVLSQVTSKNISYYYSDGYYGYYGEYYGAS